MRKAIFILACVVLCMGQTCGSPPAAPATESDAQQGIAAGLYSGQVPYTFTGVGTYDDGTPMDITQTFSSLTTANIGENGGLLSKTGDPVEIGMGVQADMGVFTFTKVVKAIQMAPGQLNILFDVSGIGGDSNLYGSFSGIDNEIYTQTGPDVISYQAEMTIGITGQHGNSATMRYDYNGTLTK